MPMGPASRSPYQQGPQPQDPAVILTMTLILLSSMKKSTSQDFEPSGKNTSETESSNPCPQPTTLSQSITGDTDNQENLSPHGGMTPMLCQLYNTLAGSTDKPGSKEWSQGPDLPYGSPIGRAGPMWPPSPTDSDRDQWEVSEEVPGEVPEQCEGTSIVEDTDGEDM
ncbi:hypothetical protein IW262DRAFT_1298599 [Armillaria fumosa]|nr:hypothetical protein IW262DRAFT_1298599 [Armillaria fumosa]